MLPSSALAVSNFELKGESRYELYEFGELFLAPENYSVPEGVIDIEEWKKGLEPVDGFSTTGGNYWFIANVVNKSQDIKWFLAPRNTLIENISAYFFPYSAENIDQSFVTGYNHRRQYLFQYGHPISLEIGERYLLALQINSRVLASAPNITLYTEEAYRKNAAINGVVMLLCFGAMIALILYNLFVYAGVRDKIYLQYSIYIAVYFTCWSLQWHVWSVLWGVEWLEFHYVFFLLLPLSNAVFCINFLKLDEKQPKMALALRVIGIVSILFIPFAFFAINYINILTTFAVASWELVALAAGVIAWRQGEKAARYFVAAFLCLLVPSMLVLPANIGLIPDLLDNTELAVLIGGTFDGLFLAFAMADRLRRLSQENVDLAENLERKVEARTGELSIANDGLKLMASELREANRAKDRFFANMSHEIRTPLTSIIGYADSLLSNETPEDKKDKAINSISASGRYLLQLINDILDLSKMEEDQLEIESMDVCLPDLLRDVTTLVSHKAQKKDISFNLDIRYPVFDRVLTDPTRLKQILINLCSNAVKFTERGSVNVVVSYDRDRLIIKIKDSGIGMTEQQKDNLFKPFVQADATISRRFGGTGLGLYLSQLLAKKLGGDITVKSVEGVGSSFKLNIFAPAAKNPSQLGNDDEFKKASCSINPKVATEKSKLCGDVLLAEDHPENNELISLILRSAGLSVVSVFNGREAIQAAEKRKFDIILMDVQMPLVDGVQATKEIRATDKQTPIIALTANVMKHEVTEYLNQGFDDHLAKPIDRNLFFERIGYYLSPESKVVSESPAGVSDPLERLQKLWVQLREGVRAADRDYCIQSLQQITVFAEDLGFSRLLSVTDQALKEKNLNLDGIAQIQRLLDFYFELDGVNFERSPMGGYIETIQDSLISYTEKNKDVNELIHEGMTPRHYPLVVDILHSIKSFSGNLGAAKLQDCCLELERLLHGHSNSAEDIDAAVLKFHGCFEELNESAEKLKGCMQEMNLV